MNPISTDHLLEQLRWRYAVKSFDPDRKISAETWSALEETLVLSPSSWGLQPWKFIVITDQATKDALVGASYGQPQVAACSHLLVIASKLSVSEADVDRYIDRAKEIQGDSEALDGLRSIIVSDIVNGPRSADVQGWAKLQCYIALGNVMTAAAMVGVDTCPMEGFVAAKYDEVLGLAAKGLTTAVLCPVGYRSGDDKYAAKKKVRFPVEDLVEKFPGSVS